MHKIKIDATGEEFSLPDKSHLTDAEELGVSGLTFGCRKGVCGMCTVEVLVGEQNLTPQQEKEKNFLVSLGYDSHNVRLACQCQIFGDVELSPL